LRNATRSSCHGPPQTPENVHGPVPLFAWPPMRWHSFGSKLCRHLHMHSFGRMHSPAHTPRVSARLAPSPATSKAASKQRWGYLSRRGIPQRFDFLCSTPARSRWRSSGCMDPSRRCGLAPRRSTANGDVNHVPSSARPHTSYAFLLRHTSPSFKRHRHGT
jgi:hypothetical protein